MYSGAKSPSTLYWDRAVQCRHNSDNTNVASGQILYLLLTLCSAKNKSKKMVAKSVSTHRIGVKGLKLDLGSKSPEFENHLRRCVVSLSKTRILF